MIDSSVAVEELTRILLSSVVYFHFRKCPPLIRILSQMNACHSFTIHFNIIILSTSGASKWLALNRFTPCPAGNLLFYACSVTLLEFTFRTYWTHAALGGSSDSRTYRFPSRSQILLRKVECCWTRAEARPCLHPLSAVHDGSYCRLSSAA